MSRLAAALLFLPASSTSSSYPLTYQVGEAPE
jgi:hypothetical protein